MTAAHPYDFIYAVCGVGPTADTFVEFAERWGVDICRAMMIRVFFEAITAACHSLDTAAVERALSGMYDPSEVPN